MTAIQAHRSFSRRCARAALAWPVVTACITLGAQSGPVATHETGGYRIAGVVLNTTTGEPVQRAVVSVTDLNDDHVVASMKTDAQGQFSFPGLAPAKYPLTASKRGYQTALYDDHEGYNTAIVTGLDQDTTHLIFFLAPASVLHGVVTADGGDPVEDATVMLFERPRGHREGEAEFRSETQTDDTGAYEFSGLADGEYLIAVTAQPWYAMHRGNGSAGTNPPKELDVAYPLTYFDSTTEEGSATPIVLAKGATEEADLHLHAVPALRFSFDGFNGMPHVELHRIAFGKEISAEANGQFDPQHRGTAEFNGVAPGQYELSFGNPKRVVNLDATESRQFDSNAGAPTVSVRGTAHLPNGAELVESDITLRPEAGAMGRTVLQGSIHNGRFRFETVAPGNWSATVTSNGTTVPVLSVATSAGAVSGDTITVHDQPVEATLTLGTQFGRVDGFARKDNRGFGGAMIVLVPHDPGRMEALARRDQSDSDGSFLLRDVVPGRYTVVAIEDGWKLNWADPGILARYLPRGTAVTLDNSSDTVHLAVPVVVQPR